MRSYTREGACADAGAFCRRALFHVLRAPFREQGVVSKHPATWLALPAFFLFVESRHTASAPSTARTHTGGVQ